MRWCCSLAPDAGSAGRARAGLGCALDGAGLRAAARSDALLVLGELTGNAICHARTDFTISATLIGGTLRIEVFDRDTHLPVLLSVDPASTSGRGLRLVAAIATEWGWNPVQDDAGVWGKVVWAELDADRGAGMPDRSCG